jgi:hypothetical protein
VAAAPGRGLGAAAGRILRPGLRSTESQANAFHGEAPESCHLESASFDAR